MGRVYNVQSGRQKAVQVLGLKELQQRVNQLQMRAVGRETAGVMVDCARLLYDEATSNLRSVNAPHEVLDDLFVYGKNPSSLLRAEKQVTALTGLRKHGSKFPSKGYAEWYPGRQVGKASESVGKMNRRGKRQRLVVPGTRSAKGGGLQKIGENLGTMWEIGTTKMPPRPWWRPAVQSARAKIYTAMLSGLRSVLGESA